MTSHRRLIATVGLIAGLAFLGFVGAALATSNHPTTVKVIAPAAHAAAPLVAQAQPADDPDTTVPDPDTTVPAPDTTTVPVTTPPTTAAPVVTDPPTTEHVVEQPPSPPTTGPGEGCQYTQSGCHFG